MPKTLIEVTEARRRVLELARPLGAEVVPLNRALGRVLAEDVSAADPVPGFDNSAMDGFAVRAADTAGASGRSPVTLRIAGESRAGIPAARTLARGEAIAISTGAMLPEGADAVVRVEDTAARNGAVAIAAQVEPGLDVRHAGEDIEPGAGVLAAGTALGAAELGVLASVGRESVSCARRPRVAILTTGDELRAPGEPLAPGCIRDSNAHSVPPLAAEAGGAPGAVEHAADEPEATRAALERALRSDIAVVCGGVSVGEHDHVRPVLSELGAREVFWGVAMRPGKPTWFGASARGGLVFGLPGNPVSAMVCFHLFARPAIRAICGARPEITRTTALLDEALHKRPGRAHFVRCRLTLGGDGLHASPTGAQGSHILTSMLGADGLVHFPSERSSLEQGERVEIELLPAGSAWSEMQG